MYDGIELSASSDMPLPCCLEEDLTETVKSN